MADDFVWKQNEQGQWIMPQDANTGPLPGTAAENPNVGVAGIQGSRGVSDRTGGLFSPQAYTPTPKAAEPTSTGVAPTTTTTTPVSPGTTQAGAGSRYPTLNPSSPTRYLYINGVLHDRTDANSPYYLSRWAYPNLPDTVTQYDAPWDQTYAYSPSVQSSMQGVGQLDPTYTRLPTSLPPWDPIVQQQQSGYSTAQAYNNYLGGLSNTGATASQPAVTNAQPQTPPQNPNSNGGSNFAQLISQLINNANRSQVVRTPLGYTQYQSSMPQGLSGNSLMSLLSLLQALSGGGNQNHQGGSRGSFWDLLNGTNSGSAGGGAGANDFLSLLLGLSQ